MEIVQGRTRFRALPQDQWSVVIPDSHPGYITWQQYQRNLQRLRENANRNGQDRRRSPPGNGSALLQGLINCGVCGKRMTLRYNSQGGSLRPVYLCQSEGIRRAEPICQSIKGDVVDEAISRIIQDAMSPTALELTLAVQHELEQRLKEADQLRRQRVARARYEADLAQQRFMQVDPKNRLVADALESEWNERLRAISEAREQYEQQSQADHAMLDEAGRNRVLALTEDFPKLWNDPNTPFRERKRMIRLIIEDVTLRKDEKITINVLFKGGAKQTVVIPRSLHAGELRRTDRQVVAEIDRLLDKHRASEIADILNHRGLRSGTGMAFTRTMVARISRNYGLKSRYDRLRESSKLTLTEIAKQLHVSTGTIKTWRHHGLLQGHVYNGKGEHLYDPPDETAPAKSQGQKLSERRRFPEVTSHHANEVQYDA